MPWQWQPCQVPMCTQKSLLHLHRKQRRTHICAAAACRSVECELAINYTRMCKNYTGESWGEIIQKFSAWTVGSCANQCNEWKPNLSSCQERVGKTANPIWQYSQKALSAITTSENIFRQLKVKSNFKIFKATVNPPAPSVEKISVNAYQWDSAWRWHEWIFVHFVTQSTVSYVKKGPPYMA